MFVKNSCNKSSHGAIHCRVNRSSKLTHLTHLNLLVFILIHCGIFWVSFTLDIVFFLTCLSTCSFVSNLPFLFIMSLVLDCGHCGITLQTSYFPKSYWINSSTLSLFISCFNSTLPPSTSFDLGAWGVYSSVIGWKIISTSSFKSKITITHDFGVAIEVVVILRKNKSCF